MIGAIAGNFRSSNRLQELAAVIRESVDDVHVVVHDPHVLFRIVGADVNGVGRRKSLSHCFQVSIMFPLPSYTTRQFSHFASLSNSRKGGPLIPSLGDFPSQEVSHSLVS